MVSIPLTVQVCTAHDKTNGNLSVFDKWSASESEAIISGQQAVNGTNYAERRLALQVFSVFLCHPENYPASNGIFESNPTIQLQGFLEAEAKRSTTRFSRHSQVDCSLTVRQEIAFGGEKKASTSKGAILLDQSKVTRRIFRRLEKKTSPVSLPIPYSISVPPVRFELTNEIRNRNHYFFAIVEAQIHTFLLGNSRLTFGNQTACNANQRDFRIVFPRYDIQSI